MDLFCLPALCVIDKEIPLSQLAGQLNRRNDRRFEAILSSIESSHLYACVNQKTYPLDCSEQKDAYLNEIVFVEIRLKEAIDVDFLTRSMLKAVKYQTVIIYSLEDEFCIAAGFTRDAKKRDGDRKVEQHYISRWQNDHRFSGTDLLDIRQMDQSSYASIYRSICMSIQKLDQERYLTLSFTSALYNYTHGADPAEGWPAHFETQKKLKERYPQNRARSKTGTENYRFSESEVFEIISTEHGYVTGDDLIETLFLFCEFEEDFNVQLPQQLADKVNDYRELLYNEADEIDEDSHPLLDYHDWVDNFDDIS